LRTSKTAYSCRRKYSMGNGTDTPPTPTRGLSGETSGGSIRDSTLVRKE
jgi:hypothetical protein